MGVPYSLVHPLTFSSNEESLLMLTTNLSRGLPLNLSLSTILVFYDYPSDYMTSPQ